MALPQDILELALSGKITVPASLCSWWQQRRTDIRKAVSAMSQERVKKLLQDLEALQAQALAQAQAQALAETQAHAHAQAQAQAQAQIKQTQAELDALLKVAPSSSAEACMESGSHSDGRSTTVVSPQAAPELGSSQLGQVKGQTLTSGPGTASSSAGPGPHGAAGAQSGQQVAGAATSSVQAGSLQHAEPPDEQPDQAGQGLAKKPRLDPEERP